MAGGTQELPLTLKKEETGGMVSIACQFFKCAADVSSLSSSDHKGDGRFSGIATVLIAGAYDIEGHRKELSPSVVVTWGEKQRFQTAVKADAPGTDINNPAFDQAFQIPITADLAGSQEKFRIALLNGKEEMGAVDVPFADVANAPDMLLQNKFPVGNGATISASVRIRGVVPGELQQQALPNRSK